MPLHDWTKVPAGLFHHFHQGWAFTIAAALNRGRLPKGLTALVEQYAGAEEGDVLAIERQNRTDTSNGGLLTLERPTTKIIRQTRKEIYARRASVVSVRHHMGQIVAVVEIVSPGNKDSRAAIRDFVEKSIAYLQEGIHLLVIDLFPPTKRDPFGIHKIIWDEIVEEDFVFPEGKDRILASYETGGVKSAYVEPVAVGDILPEMPLFLESGIHVKVPLEATYCSTWDASGEDYQEIIKTGVVPDPNAEPE